MNWFKNEHDKRMDAVRSLFDEKVSKYDAVVGHLRSLQILERNYSKAMSELSASIAKDCATQDSKEATINHLSGLLGIKAAHSLKFADELDDLVEKDLSKFFGEYKLGLQNIFKDLRLIGRKVEEMKNDFSLSETTYKTLKGGSYVESFRRTHILNKGTSVELNGMKYREQFLNLIRDIFNTKEEFEQQMTKIKSALKSFDRRHFDFTRDLIMKMYIHQMSTIKNLEYDLGNSIEVYKNKGEYKNVHQLTIDSLEVPNKPFFEKLKQDMYNTEHDYLFAEVSDEQYNVYDLKVFLNEAVILSKLFHNEQLQVQEKAKLQAMAKGERDDGAVFFSHFLGNLLRNKNKEIIITREVFDFLKNCLLRPFIRKFMLSKNFKGLFRLIYNWQFVRVKDDSALLISDLKNEAFIKIEDFWVESLFVIFSPYKNGSNTGKVAKLLLLKNYKSCVSIIGSEAANRVFTTILELKLGTEIEYLELFKDAEPSTEQSPILYTEEDIQKKLNIFDNLS